MLSCVFVRVCYNIWAAHIPTSEHVRVCGMGVRGEGGSLFDMCRQTIMKAMGTFE